MTLIIVYIIPALLAAAIVLGSKPNFHIVGGFEAKWNSVPWTCSVRYKRADTYFGSGHWCGCTLINSTTIVTAAHCFINHSVQYMFARELLIVGGSLNRFDPKNASYIGRVYRLIIHQQYEEHSYANDIAIIILGRPVPIDDQYFKPIPLIANDTILAVNVTCTISGWGRLSFGGQTSRTLRMANILLFARERCNAYPILPLKTLCAGQYGGVIDACQGDSGGPMVCDGVLAGIVSFGKDCAMASYPGVYTAVQDFLPWIARGCSSMTRLATPIIVLILFIFFK